MNTGDEDVRVFRFGAFTLDAARMTLLRGAERVHLTEKPLEVLVFLVRNAGRTVSKAELMEAVWADTFVTDDNLTQAVLKIRRALGDETGDSRFILTVPRVGYRFIGTAASPKPVEAAPGEGVAVGLGRRRHIHPAWALVAGFVVMALAAGFWRAGHSRSASHRDRSEAPSPAPVPLEIPLPTASATKPVFAPDGATFLFVGYRKERPGVGDLYLAATEGRSVRRVSQGLDPRGDHPVFSPDGTEVICSRWRNGDDGTRWPDLWAVPVAGGPARVILEQASGAGFSPDGRWMGYTKHLPGGRPLWISARTELGRHREVGPLGFTPRWSPDGRWLAYTTSNPEGGQGELWVASADLSARKLLSGEPEQLYGVAWDPDSLSLVVASDQGKTFGLWRVPIGGTPRTPVARGIGGYFSPSISADGRVLLFSHVVPARSLYAASALGGGSDVELTTGQYHAWPACSPDGRQILSVIQTPGFGNRAYVTGVSGGETVPVSDRPASHPVWLDGARLAYLHEDSTGGTEVRVGRMPAGEDRVLCRFAEPASWLAVGRQGRRIGVVLTAPDRRQRIVVRDLDTGRDTTVAEGGEYEHLRWAPGPGAISWSGPVKSAGPASDGIWVLEPGAPGPRRIVPDGYNPAWSDDGMKVYYSRIGDRSGLWCYDVRRSASVKIRSWTEVESFDVCAGNLVFARVASDTHIFRLPLK